VDRIGKEISGAGMDTNVIGRKRSTGARNSKPARRALIVRDLSEERMPTPSASAWPTSCAADRDKIDCTSPTPTPWSPASSSGAWFGVCPTDQAAVDAAYFMRAASAGGGTRPARPRHAAPGARVISESFLLRPAGSRLDVRMTAAAGVRCGGELV